ncbi:MAG: LuxR C-terminal-related transcriptional regulator [Planctomycetota bacterium]|jgi:DNA-binding NarL/FixJ family response regulator
MSDSTETAPLNSPVTVWLCEDNERFRRSLDIAINQIDGLSCEASLGSVEDTLEQIARSGPPQVLLLDIGLPGMDGISGLPKLREAAPDAKIVILTVFDEHDKVFRAVCAGADGYLLKTSTVERIGEAIQEVVSGGASMNPEIARKVLDVFSGKRPQHSGPGLTDRELDVLRLVVRGMTKKEIASELGLSTHTVDTHLRNIYQKLHVNNRAGAVAAAMREGLV